VCAVLPALFRAPSRTASAFLRPWAGDSTVSRAFWLEAVAQAVRIPGLRGARDGRRSWRRRDEVRTAEGDEGAAAAGRGRAGVPAW